MVKHKAVEKRWLNCEHLCNGRGDGVAGKCQHLSAEVRRDVLPEPTDEFYCNHGGGQRYWIGWLPTIERSECPMMKEK